MRGGAEIIMKKTFLFTLLFVSGININANATVYVEAIEKTFQESTVANHIDKSKFLDGLDSNYFTAVGDIIERCLVSVSSDKTQEEKYNICYQFVTDLAANHNIMVDNNIMMSYYDPVPDMKTAIYSKDNAYFYAATQQFNKELLRWGAVDNGVFESGSNKFICSFDILGNGACMATENADVLFYYDYLDLHVYHKGSPEYIEYKNNANIWSNYDPSKDAQWLDSVDTIDMDYNCSELVETSSIIASPKTYRYITSGWDIYNKYLERVEIFNNKLTGLKSLPISNRNTNECRRLRTNKNLVNSHEKGMQALDDVLGRLSGGIPLLVNPDKFESKEQVCESVRQIIYGSAASKDLENMMLVEYVKPLSNAFIRCEVVCNPSIKKATGSLSDGNFNIRFEVNDLTGGFCNE